ncbi:MAG: DNA (cytosine-5-)-methyltransferase [Colwellia sp.]
MNGQSLKKSRIDLGLSQSKLSDLSGIVQAKISSFELGKSELSEKEIANLASIISSLDTNQVNKLKKKRYRTVNDGASVMSSRPRRGYATTGRNAEYLQTLKNLEKTFFEPTEEIRRPKAISFFAGCGGLCYGMKAAGFDIVATNELVEEYKDIYRENFPSASFFPNDIRSISGNDLSPYIGVDLMIGGPPCQGFSLAGKRDVNDERNTLFQNYLNIADIVKPKVIIMENVRLLTSMKDADGSLVRDRILKTFKQHGYVSEFYELNSKDFGVAQHRERVFFIGVRADLNKYPTPPNSICSSDDDLFSTSGKYFTFGDAVSDLEFLESSEQSEKDLLHKAVKHPEHVLRWLVDVPQGKSAHDNIDENLRPPSGYNTTYKRQVWDEPAGTVATTYSMISGCRNVHPIATRSLTTREALRLQSFPDSFKLKGKLGDIRTTIGNAVPPKLAFALGEHVIKNYIL